MTRRGSCRFTLATLVPLLLVVTAAGASATKPPDTSAGVAADLYQLALPFRAQTVINPGGNYLGSVEHHLGVMAATFGEDELACEHLAAALVAHGAGGADEWVRRTEQQLVAVGATDDRPPAVPARPIAR